MKLKLEELAPDTVFKYAGHIYMIGGTTGWLVSADYVESKGIGFLPHSSGRKQKGTVHGICIHPKCGGVFQDKVKMWLPFETEVTVEHELA